MKTVNKNNRHTKIAEHVNFTDLNKIKTLTKTVAYQ